MILLDNQNYLTMGENTKEGSFRVLLETMFCPGVSNSFKVTPVGYPTGQRMKFKLAYIFIDLRGLNSSLMPPISAALTLENNSIPIKDSYTDGESEDFLVNVGNFWLMLPKDFWRDKGKMLQAVSTNHLW